MIALGWGLRYFRRNRDGELECCMSPCLRILYNLACRSPDSPSAIDVASSEESTKDGIQYQTLSSGVQTKISFILQEGWAGVGCLLLGSLACRRQLGVLAASAHR